MPKKVMHSIIPSQQTRQAKCKERTSLLLISQSLVFFIVSKCVKILFIILLFLNRRSTICAVSRKSCDTTTAEMLSLHRRHFPVRSVYAILFNAWDTSEVLYGGIGWVLSGTSWRERGIITHSPSKTLINTRA